jgi:hypothetical protein
MPQPPPNLPKVDGETELYRAITNPDWWDSENHCVTLDAFHDRLVSAYITSRTSPETILATKWPGTGIVKFKAETARQLEYEVLHEFDPAIGEDESHVHLYRQCGSKQRKKRAQALAETCEVVIQLDVDRLRSELQKRSATPEPSSSEQTEKESDDM